MVENSSEESSDGYEDRTKNKDNSDNQPLKTPIKEEPNDPDSDVPENKDGVNTGGTGIVPNDKELNSNGIAPIKSELKSPTHVSNVGDSNSNSANVAAGTGANVGTGHDVTVKNVCMDPHSDEIQSKLTKLGCLIVDENVLYALKNLKQMGETMKCAVENDAEAHRQAQQAQSCGKSLFKDFHSNVGLSFASGLSMDILTPIGGGASRAKEESRQSLNFNSPPHSGSAFSGMKHLLSEAFAEVTSSLKRKQAFSRSPTSGSPSHTQSSMEILQSQAEAKGKLALAAETFIWRKNITNNNKMLVFDAVTKRKRYVIDFDEGPQSFYCIMTHYAPDLNFMPDDVKHKELQQHLFTFVMQNVSYTKVFFFKMC